MSGLMHETHQLAIGELSPPYDGSEMDLFPDLSFLDSVQSDFLNTGFDELAPLPQAVDSAEQSDHDDGEGQPDSVPVIKGIVSQSKNPTLIPIPNSPEGKSVIKVIVNSSKDENELVKYLMRKDHHGPAPKLTIIKKSTSSVGKSPDFDNSVTTTQQEMKIDSTISVVASSNTAKSRPGPNNNKTNTKKMSVIEKLEQELQVCDPINRNAIAARLNRMRKKNHVEALEESVKNLQAENSELTEQNRCLNSKVSSLETEVSYLKSILANQSSLSSLLSNIQATNLNFHTSMDTVHNIVEEDIDTVFHSKNDEDEEIDVEGVSCHQSSVPEKRKRRCIADKTDLINGIDKKRKKASVPSRMDRGGGQKRSSDGLSEHKPEKMSDNVQATGGVCLHVSGKNVSLEFCSHCSQKAQTMIQKNKPSQKIKDGV